mmetsp:Transcript_8950/g.13455  ORF Transcript_8950/g.13455 Transcript_8950/m.13455 type:complete len:85 (-) Transcript_8950:81-335(-)
MGAVNRLKVENRMLCVFYLCSCHYYIYALFYNVDCCLMFAEMNSDYLAKLLLVCDFETGSFSLMRNATVFLIEVQQHIIEDMIA